MRLPFLALIVSLLNRRPFLSPRSVTLSVESQEEMNISGTLEKTPPVNIGGLQRTEQFLKKKKRYLDRSESQGVDIGELEYYLLGPSELDVDIRYLALHARGEQQQRLFHTFSQKGTTDFLVTPAARWDEHERKFVTPEQKCQELCQANKWAKGKNCWWLRWKGKRLCKEKRQKNSKADFSRNQELGGKTL